MTKVLFDVVDVAGGVEPGDSVVVWPPHVIGTAGGKVKNTRPETIRVDAGPVTVDLDPGPLWVQLQCGDRADTDPKLIRVPEPDENDGPVPLIGLLNKVMHYDPVQESESGKNAKRAEAAAAAAKSSETNAANSAAAAKSSEENAAGSATAAGTSETNAKTSETNAADSATAAKNSASAAKESADRVGSAERVLEAETNAANSATAAKNSETAASKSEKNSADSATAAGESATAARNSETAAGESASSAAGSATDSAGSATAAGQSATAAKTSETNAAGSATAAKNSETAAGESATAAGKSETNAANYAQSSKDSATRAETAAEGVQQVVNNAANAIREGVATDATRAETARGQAEQFAADAGNAARIEVDKLKGDAPEAFDTLGEIARELESNESERAALTNQIAEKAGTEWVKQQLTGKSDTDHKHTLSNITDAPNSHSTSPTPNSLVSRSAAGFFFVNKPTNPDHPTNKDYVDGEVAKKANSSHTHKASDVSGLSAKLERLDAMRAWWDWDGVGDFVPPPGAVAGDRVVNWSTGEVHLLEEVQE